ncbi:MAG: tail fiber domain-containing protein [Phycisphaeraceae bacterium]|nr:tail fiber domain-containing protein [Phycisphaeraceae bacterium]
MAAILKLMMRCVAAGACLVVASVSYAGPQTTFTFQGVLEQAKGSFSGPTPMMFTLWDAIIEGNQLGQTVVYDGSEGNGAPVNIADSGSFAVSLDFGVPVWGTGQSRYVEVTADGELQQPRFIIVGSTFSSNTRGLNVMPNGNVGIGTTNPGSFLLAVNGAAANRTGSWSVLSDARLKKDIRDVQRGTLDRLLELRGVEFEYTEEALAGHNVASGPMVGFLAQDVECVFPEWIECDENGMRFVTERGTTALMVEALRELRNEKDRQIDDLKAQHQAEIDRIERAKDTKIAELEARLERLEQAAGK